MSTSSNNEPALISRHWSFVRLMLTRNRSYEKKFSLLVIVFPPSKSTYESRVKISQICSELNVDGLRGDIVTNRASQAIAAFENRTRVTPHDIFRVIPLCLRHRLRKDPLEGIDSGEKVRETFQRVFNFNGNLEEE